MDRSLRTPLALLALLLLLPTTGCVQQAVREVRNDLVTPTPQGRSTVLELKIEKYEDLSREFPDEPLYPERLARLYWLQKDHRTALRHLDRAIRLDPENSKYEYLKGTIYAGIGNYRLAKASLREVIEGTGAEYTGPYIQLAEICLREDNPTEARTYLQRCLEVDPAFPTPHYYLGAIALGQRDQKGAIEHFEQYLRLGAGPQFEEVIQTLRNLQPELRVHHIR